MLINSYAERCERACQKQQTLLKFMRDETWTSAAIAAQVLQQTLPAAYKSLAIFERKNLLIRHEIPQLKMHIWGITPMGLLHAWDDEPMQNRSYFQPSKISHVMVQHHLDLQQARFHAARADWGEWLPGNLLPGELKQRPDAVVKSQIGESIAVELERTVKTKKRYEAIFSHYLQSIKNGDYHCVHYVCPDADFAAKLRRLFALIDAIPVAGQRVQINEKHRARFPVHALSHWPPSH